MSYTHLLFDLDNTLLDFSASSNEALRDIAKLLEVRYDKNFLDIYHDINFGVWTEFENGLIDSITLRRKRFELTAKHYGHTIDGLMMNRKYLQGIVNHTVFVDGAQEVLAELSNSHSLSIITNGLKEVQRPRLKSAKIYDYFDHIVVSDEIGVAKPDGRYFEYAWKKIDKVAKDKVLVIGDNPNSDIQGAKDFGFHACLFDPLGMKDEHVGDYKIDDLRQILEIVGA